MKKIAAVILAVVTVISLAGCGKKYKAVKSTKEEARTVLTLNIGGEEYEVKYELYRALFLNYKSTVDGGNNSVWSGADSAKYVNEINKMIVSRAAEIYSVIALAEQLGLEPYSKDIDETIYARIELSVEGNGVDVVGFGGDYDAYLASLKAMNLNYSVQTLMLRYSIMLEKINEYYIGTFDSAMGHMDGQYSYTRDDVKSYYESDKCVRILHAFVGKNKMSNSLDVITALRDDIIKAESDIDVALLIINRTTAVTSDNLSGKKVTGIMLGKGVVSDGIYAAYRDTAFSMKPGEVSEIIEVGGTEPGYYVLYALEKNSEHFEFCYDTVKFSYLDNVVGEKLNNLAQSGVTSVRYTDDYNSINHKNISMD